MSINAFQEDSATKTQAATSSVTYVDGVVSSNFYIVSTTVGDNEVFTAIAQHKHQNAINKDGTRKNDYTGTGYRDAQLNVTLADAHGDLTGKSVVVLLSNGDKWTVDCTANTVTQTLDASNYS